MTARCYIYRGQVFLAGLALVLTSGCSTVINAHQQKAGMMEAYASADVPRVMDKINGKLKEPHWYNSSTVNTGDELMWRLEAGSLNFNTGNFQESIDQFSAAEKLIADYDERARVSARDAAAEAGMALTNLNTLPYRGFCRDRMALGVYKSLAYLGAGREDAFRAQLKRLRNAQKKVLDDYREFFDAEQAELKAAREQHPEAAKKEQEQASGDKIKDESKNKEFTAGLQTMREVAHRGYGGFLNPAAIFLSGLGSVRDGNYDNARIDFQRLYEAMPNNAVIRRYCVTVLDRAGRDIPKPLRGVKKFDFPLDRDCVYVLFANGRSAAFKEIAVYFPVMTAWPMCEFYPPPFDKAVVHAGKADYETVPLADMDGILAQEFEQRLPGIITRIVLSALIKEGAYYAGLAAAWHASFPVNVILVSSIAIGGAIYRCMVNTADTRTWELLPKEFQVTQFPMPKDHKVVIALGSNRQNVRELEIPDDCRSAILFVNAPSTQNVSCHILPFKTK